LGDFLEQSFTAHLWQLEHSDYGEDAKVVLSTCTFSVSLSQIT